MHRKHLPDLKDAGSRLQQALVLVRALSIPITAWTGSPLCKQVDRLQRLLNLLLKAGDSSQLLKITCLPFNASKAQGLAEPMP